MRHLSIAVFLALTACASNSDAGCSCGRPAPAPGFGYTSFGSDVFIDTDDDGIPDKRLPAPTPATPPSLQDDVRASITRAANAVAAAADGDELEAALAALNEAVADARRRLGASR